MAPVVMPGQAVPDLLHNLGRDYRKNNAAEILRSIEAQLEVMIKPL
jgi:hypothetical protein